MSQEVTVSPPRRRRRKRLTHSSINLPVQLVPTLAQPSRVQDKRQPQAKTVDVPVKSTLEADPFRFMAPSSSRPAQALLDEVALDNDDTDHRSDDATHSHSKRMLKQQQQQQQDGIVMSSDASATSSRRDTLDPDSSSQPFNQPPSNLLEHTSASTWADKTVDVDTPHQSTRDRSRRHSSSERGQVDLSGAEVDQLASSPSKRLDRLQGTFSSSSSSPPIRVRRSLKRPHSRITIDYTPSSSSDFAQLEPLTIAERVSRRHRSSARRPPPAQPQRSRLIFTPESGSDDDNLLTHHQKSRYAPSANVLASEICHQDILELLQVPSPPPLQFSQLVAPYQVLTRPRPLSLHRESSLPYDQVPGAARPSRHQAPRHTRSNRRNDVFLTSLDQTAFRYSLSPSRHAQHKQHTHAPDRAPRKLPASVRALSKTFVDKVASELAKRPRGKHRRNRLTSRLKALDLTPAHEEDSGDASEEDSVAQSAPSRSRLQTVARPWPKPIRIVKKSKLDQSKQRNRWSKRSLDRPTSNDPKQSTNSHRQSRAEQQREYLSHLPTPPRNKFRFVTTVGAGPTANMRPPLFADEDGGTDGEEAMPFYDSDEYQMQNVALPRQAVEVRADLVAEVAPLHSVHPSILFNSADNCQLDDAMQGAIPRTASSSDSDRQPQQARTSSPAKGDLSSLTRRPRKAARRACTTRIDPPPRAINTLLFRRTKTTFAEQGSDRRKSDASTIVSASTRVRAKGLQKKRTHHGPSVRDRPRQLFRKDVPLAHSTIDTTQQLQRSRNMIPPNSSSHSHSHEAIPSASLDQVGAGQDERSNGGALDAVKDGLWDSLPPPHQPSHHDTVDRPRQLHDQAPLCKTPFADITSDDAVILSATQSADHTSIGSPFDRLLPVVDYLAARGRSTSDQSMDLRIAEAEDHNIKGQISFPERFHDDFGETFRPVDDQIDLYGLLSSVPEQGLDDRTEHHGEKDEIATSALGLLDGYTPFSFIEEDDAVLVRSTGPCKESVRPHSSPAELQHTSLASDAAPDILRRRLYGPPPPSDPTALVSLPSTFATSNECRKFPRLKRATTVWGGINVEELGRAPWFTLMPPKGIQSFEEE
ncbi:hypothetical protein OIO90_002515 [Microbotryomycetes sp. JL221]|nr:hypothetical protein OIO90_002515 [Microbotryomycetes sp. JL221]